jgi:hypothetical protein
LLSAIAGSCVIMLMVMAKRETFETMVAITDRGSGDH